MLNLSGISLSDADLWALKQALAAAQPPSTPIAIPPSIPATSGPFVRPPLLVGRSVMNVTAPWVNGARFTSGGALTDSNCWAIHFTPQAGATTLRLEGGENGGGTIHRNWIVYRADTGEVLGKCPQPSTQTTVQVQCSIGRPGDPRHWEIRVEPGVEYVLVIVNYDPGKTSAMFMDLFLS